VKKTLFEIIKEETSKLLLSDIYPLLSHALMKTKEFIFTHPEYEPSHVELRKWDEYKKRRKKGEPVAYITGEKEFYSLPFKVSRDTLIPRPETELLVDEILDRKPQHLLDIGTGTGNIAISVKYHFRSCFITVTDISENILEIARDNAWSILGTHDIQFIKSDFFGNLKGEKYDIIVSNPPYIVRERLAELQAEVRDWEPLGALDGGVDGLDAYRGILKVGWKYLMERGAVILEVDPEILKGIFELLKGTRYRIESIKKDLAGADRMVVIKYE
jgi:release factor glutamine methyltransferase